MRANRVHAERGATARHDHDTVSTPRHQHSGQSDLDDLTDHHDTGHNNKPRARNDTVHAPDNHDNVAADDHDHQPLIRNAKPRLARC